MEAQIQKEPPRFVRPDQYAARRGVSEATVGNWVRNGTIPSIKIKRLVLIDPIEADAALVRFKRPAKP